MSVHTFNNNPRGPGSDPILYPTSYIWWSRTLTKATVENLWWRRGRWGGESHDSEWVGVICSCPFITFIKVWGDTITHHLTHSVRRRKWYDGQLQPLLQQDSRVNFKIWRTGGKVTTASASDLSYHHVITAFSEMKNLHEFSYEMLSNVVKNVLHLDLRISCSRNFRNVKNLTLDLKMGILRASLK